MIPVGSVDGEHRRGITAAVRDRERAYRAKQVLNRSVCD